MKQLRMQVKLFCCVVLVFLFVAGCKKDGDTLTDLRLLGTRSWIRVMWQGGAPDYRIYWSDRAERPEKYQQLVKSPAHRFYIRDVEEMKKYYVWVEAGNQPGVFLEDSVVTVRHWELDAQEAATLYPASSAAVPQGMELYWHDEFNDSLLNRNKWTTNYYSNWDFIDRTNWDDFQNNTLPQPFMVFTDTTIRLITNEQMPERDYWKSGRKISSIQTFDWKTQENYLDNSVGGYFEVKVRRHAKEAEMVNTAFWFDSPGPDLKYYLEAGNKQFGVEGIRPRGQVFEIDVFEYLNAEVVLHGNVSPEGEFQGNIGHYIVKDEQFENKWVTHGMLWTPSALYFYVNGKLKTAWADPWNIKSPDHIMNVFLGTYGKGGEVEMEVDYIRYYRWALEEGNELPNAGFEYGDSVFPWEGNGKLEKENVRSGLQAVLLNAGDSITQYVYADYGKTYNLSCWARGEGKLLLSVERLTPVEAKVTESFVKECKLQPDYRQTVLTFVNPAGREGHKQTLKITVSNIGNSSAIIDDMQLKQQ